MTKEFIIDVLIGIFTASIFLAFLWSFVRVLANNDEELFIFLVTLALTIPFNFSRYLSAEEPNIKIQRAIETCCFFLVLLANLT